MWAFKKPVLGKAATLLLVLGLAGNTGGIILRWVESHQMGIGRAPFTNLFESLAFFSWTITAMYLVIERQYKIRILGAFAAPLAFLSLAYAGLQPDRILPLMPALKSNWLIGHVITCFLGYAAFAVAFGVAIIYLLKRRDYGLCTLTGLVSGIGTGIAVALFANGRAGSWFLAVMAIISGLCVAMTVAWVVWLFVKYRKTVDPKAGGRFISALPDPGILDELAYQTILFGFLFLTVGIITGAVWANSAWGRYWSWDPKETWSLVTWLIYASMIHARIVRGWRGRRTIYLSLLGFAAVMFTYFGVNLVLKGLHSYA